MLAVCSLVLWHDGPMRALLAEGGLAAPLVEIINSHRDEVDVVERGLFAIGSIAYVDGKECVDCEEDVVVFVVKLTHPNISFHLFPSAAGVNKLIRLGIVSTLEKIMESHSNNHDVMWPASDTCDSLARFGR